MTEIMPGLVTLYDIRPGNGVGLFLQPRSPLGATNLIKVLFKYELQFVTFTWSCGCHKLQFIFECRFY